MDSLTQKQLRDMLKSRGLSPRGNKIELIHRMQAWEQNKIIPKKENKKKRKSFDGKVPPNSGAKRKKEGTSTANSNTLSNSTGGSNNKRNIKKEGVTALELLFSNYAVRSLSAKDKASIRGVCKVWHHTAAECSILGFSINTQFINAYLSDFSTIPKESVPTFVLRSKPYNLCFGVDVETQEMACLILNANTVVKALHGPKDDSTTENDPLNARFKDLKGYCPERFPFNTLVSRILRTCVMHEEKVGQLAAPRIDSTNQLLTLMENAFGPHIPLKRDKQGKPRAHYCLQQLCVIVLTALHELAPSRKTQMSSNAYAMLDEYTAELAIAKSRISEYMYKFDESNGFLVQSARQLFQEILDVISASPVQAVSEEKSYTGAEMRTEMEKMLAFFSSCQDRLQNDWLERLQRIIECHVSALVDNYGRYANRDLQNLKNSLAKQLPAILHHPERVKEVLYTTMQDIDRVALGLREQGRVLCKRSLPSKKIARTTTFYNNSRADLMRGVKKEAPENYMHPNSHGNHHHEDPGVVVESSDLMNKIRLHTSPSNAMYPLIDMQQAAQDMFMDLCRKYRDLTTPDMNDPKHCGDYSMKGWEYFREWLPQILQKAIALVEYGDAYNALFLITQLSILLLRNDCSWLRWAHYFEEEDTGELEHKAIFSITSAIAQLSSCCMPALKKDEILRRWYSYTLRDIMTNLTHLAEDDPLLIEIETVCDAVEEITSAVLNNSTTTTSAEHHNNNNTNNNNTNNSNNNNNNINNIEELSPPSSAENTPPQNTSSSSPIRVPKVEVRTPVYTDNSAVAVPEDSKSMKTEMTNQPKTTLPTTTVPIKIEVEQTSLPKGGQSAT